MKPALLLAFVLSLAAALPSAAEAPDRPAPSGGILSLLPAPQQSEHSLAIDGRTLRYDATAATLSLLSGSGEVTAEIFYVAYTLKPEAGAPPQRDRPITFVFNGGPGAASAYLHLGALGPRTLAMAENGEFLPPPQELVDNRETWLAMTDLVFVDPVGTGYSREAPGQDIANFWGVQQDASSMGAFIRLYLSQAGRTGSPVFLAGESYGGFRVALLAKTLQEDGGVRPSGVILISPALEFTLVRPDEFQPLHWALELPSLAAVRLRSTGLSGDALQEKLAEVEGYAMGEYLTAITNSLEEGGKTASPRIAEITGLPLDLVRRNFARISTSLFVKEFARSEGKVLSPYDATIGTADIAPDSPWPSGPDPILDRSVPVLTTAFVDYLRRELNFQTPISYRLLNREISGKWDYGTSANRQGYAGVMGDLQRARSLNPSLGVVIVNGNTDLVTPYMVSRYLARQMPTLEGARPIELDVIDGGHMMYFTEQGRRELKAAVEGLYQSAR